MTSETGRPWIRRLLTVAFVVVLFLPVIRNVDGLPLSTYPMYASTRSSEIWFVAASGVGSSGERSTLTVSEIANTRDPLIAQAFLNDAVDRGDTDRVCLQIAQRVGNQFVEIEIAVELHDVVKHTRGQESLIDRDLYSQCPVAR